MSIVRRSFFLLVFLVHSIVGGLGCVYAASPPPIVWQNLEPGLDMARVDVNFFRGGADASEGREGEQLSERARASVTLLRIMPDRFAFSLHMASEKGLAPLGELADREGFIAAINAGMFQQDKLTSTGYLKNATHANNARIASNFGAFFVAEPLGRSRLPQARLLDRQRDDWKADITRYAIVMQNYRMNAPDGVVLWKRRDRLHTISALSQDASGRLYFIFCRDLVQGTDFATQLLRLPLQLQTLMYLEGGSEAALLIRSGGINTVETGPQLWGRGSELLLPNVLGLRRKPSL